MLGGDKQRLFVTLGQFSVIRLERPAQIIVPIVDYALPTKECCADPGGCAEDPCALFEKVPFPAEAFIPTGCDRTADGNGYCKRSSAGAFAPALLWSFGVLTKKKNKSL